MKMDSIIKAEQLCRNFIVKGTEKKAVDQLSMMIKEGSIFGLLGPNGAGKSTTIKMMTTLLLPTSGSLEVLGHDVYKEEKHIRAQIGFLYGGETGLYWQLSGRDNLRYFGSLFKIEQKLLEQRIDYWLERVGLTKDQNVLTMRYSKGMKQRLHIARTMLHEPQLMFMDEPTLGLDPKGTVDLRQIVMEMKQSGKTIILTTHDMQEAQELCDEIGFIMDGRLITQGTFNQLQEQFQEVNHYEIELVKSPDLGVLDRSFQGVECGVTKRLENGNVVVDVKIPKTEQGEIIYRDILALLSPYTIRQLILRKMDLRDIYLQLVNDKVVESDPQLSIVV